MLKVNRRSNIVYRFTIHDHGFTAIRQPKPFAFLNQK
jgi:hypothetical protein